MAEPLLAVLSPTPSRPMGKEKGREGSRDFQRWYGKDGEAPWEEGGLQLTCESLVAERWLLG